MKKKFGDLRARMPPESQVRAKSKADKMRAEMPPGEVQQAGELSISDKNLVTPKHWFEMPELERSERCNLGISAAAFQQTAQLLGVSRRQLHEMLALSKSISTINRKIRTRGTLGATDSGLVVGLLQMIGFLQSLTDDVLEFDAGLWLAAWLNQPIRALKNQKARSYLNTEERQQVIFRLLSSIETGVYV